MPTPRPLRSITPSSSPSYPDKSSLVTRYSPLNYNPRMKRALLFLFIIISTLAFATPKTMRLDYYHTGDNGKETFSLDRVVVEPLPWLGNPAKNIDDSNLGKYFFEVRDKQTNRILYSRGYASIFGEWETTDEAKHLARTFSESLRFPAPDTSVVITVSKR